MLACRIYSYTKMMCYYVHRQTHKSKYARETGSPSLEVNSMSVAALKMRDRVEKDGEERVRKG